MALKLKELINSSNPAQPNHVTVWITTKLKKADSLPSDISWVQVQHKKPDDSIQHSMCLKGQSTSFTSKFCVLVMSNIYSCVMCVFCGSNEFSKI